MPPSVIPELFSISSTGDIIGLAGVARLVKSIIVPVIFRIYCKVRAVNGNRSEPFILNNRI